MKRFLTNLSVMLLLVTFSYCQKNNSSNGQQYRFNGTMNVDERTRTYLLNLPPHYYDNDSASFALVLGCTAVAAALRSLKRITILPIKPMRRVL